MTTVSIVTTSSFLDSNTVEILTKIVQGDRVVSESREVYDTQWLLDNRFLSGTITDRIEYMRAAAESVTEKALMHRLTVPTATAETATALFITPAQPVSEEQGKAAVEALMGTPAPAPKKTRKTTAKPTATEAQ